MPRELVDSHLVRVLHVLLTERSVSRTAMLLGQSQPAISVALRRLRAITGDPLLVRSGNRMVPTAHGMALVEPAQQALCGIGRIMEPVTSFDPAHSTRTFRIGSPDYLDVFFVPAVIERFHAQAPNAMLEIRHLMVDGGYEQGLASGDLDLVIGNWRTPPENLHLQSLCTDELVCLLREDHPIGHGAMTAQAYAGANHLAVTTRNLAGQGTIDVELARAGLSRKVTTQVPYFCMAPYVLVRSSLVFTTTRAFASHYANLLPLRIEPLPAQARVLRYYQLWHERAHRDLGSRWLRSIVADAARALVPDQ
ncbi:LysR family transcriptional regulator [Cupriavidus numazuensis]|uniref:HTH-type transcriptional regulator SyrM 1 n=1 Tax=Cupriavidus numazuensis TaxID=221992 RepID=A0ABN7Q457_9BURK|nr:LysR family transcriptional regulator [Cupriavidus numazuensis]CAG2156439.1 HTH-type transcriptional regulator SyrM 1 [Cupriavidus numazuensis]